MSQRTDAEFEHIIHDPDAVLAPAAESADAKHLRDELEPAHATETGELREYPQG
jgi:hypothetical protein